MLIDFYEPVDSRKEYNMKLLDFIFAKPKKQEEKPKWTIENNGWEANARRYNQLHGLPAKQIW